MSFKFEDLKVWQKAIELTEAVSEASREFPKEEMYVLVSQFKRAADSVALNIAEGSTGQTNAEFRKFLSYAIRSNAEVVCCLHIGRRRNLIADEQFGEIYQDCEEISKMLSGLRHSLGD